MNRVDFYFRQLVSETELDGAFADAENALWTLAQDVGLFGAVTGGALTETNPVSMNLQSSAPLVAYDQAGRRIYHGPIQTVDCSIDEDGNPTVPSAGMQRWITITAEFSRNLSDPRVDGNGATVYYNRDEAFTLAVVAGAESALSPTRPTKPDDRIVLGDVLLVDSTVHLHTVDIDTTRRDDFVWTSADKISVVSSGWTQIVPSADRVQEALDAVDGNLVAQNASEQITRDLIPATAGNDLGSALLPWDLYVRHVAIDASGRITGNMIPNATGQDLGATGARWDAFLESATMYGAISAATDGLDFGSTGQRFRAYVTTLTAYTSILAGADQLALGGASLRFTAHLYDATIYNSLKSSANGNPLGDATNRFTGHFHNLTAYNSILAATDQLALGSSGNRWNAHFYSAIIYSLIEAGTDQGASLGDGSHRFLNGYVKNLYIPNDGLISHSPSPKAWSKRVINVPEAAFYEAPWTAQIRRTVGARAIVGIAVNDPSPLRAWIGLDGVPHGASIGDLTITWYQASGTAAMTAGFYRVTRAGVATLIGSAITIAASGSWQDQQAFSLAGATVLDKLTYHYGIQIDDVPGSVQCAVAGVEADYEVTSVLNAAEGN